MPWPNGEGLFLIRAIAQPDAYVDGKEGDGSDRIVRRAPSISTILVELQDPKRIGKEAVDKSETDLAKAQAELELAERHGATEKELEDARSNLRRAELSAQGSSQDLILEAYGAKLKERSACDKADLIKMSRLNEEVDALYEQSVLAARRVQAAGSRKKPVRLKASFISRITGQTVPLLLDLLELPGTDLDDPDPAERVAHYGLSDVTSKDSGAIPAARRPLK